MPGIELLLEKEDSKAARVTFRWRDTIICLEETWSHAGERYLHVMPVAAGTADCIAAGRLANWIISGEDAGRSGAGASITFAGAASSVIGGGTRK
jgi:hypothetical protein